MDPSVVDVGSMTMELVAAEDETERGSLSSNSTTKNTETASSSEMTYKRKRDFLGLNLCGTKVSTPRSHESRPGLYQLLDSEEDVPVRLSPTGLADAFVPCYRSEVAAGISPGRRVEPGQEAWHLPDLNRFAEKASNFRRRLASLVDENVTRDIRRNLMDWQVPWDGEHVSEHEPSSQSEEGSNLANGSTSATMMDMRQQFLSVPPMVWNGFVSRVQTTLRGSADDIGWLAKCPNYTPVKDGTVDFLKALEQIGRGIHPLPNNLTYLLIPGLFSNHGELYFFDTEDHFAKLGLPCHIAKIQSEAAVETNAREIKDHVQELYRSTGRRVVLLGHSKGGVDAAAACSMFWPELKDIVVGIVTVQSPYGGSPIASDILREGSIADVETRRIIEILISKIFKGDIRSLEDLTHEKRKEFLLKHPLPPEVPVISFHTEASRAPRDVSMMSHIAHAHLPWLQDAKRKLYVTVPLSLAMAMCALHLELRYNEKSDGLVARKDAEVPGSTVVRPEKKLDHAWMVYAPSRREDGEPDAAQMCEALVMLLLKHPRCSLREEIGPLAPEAAPNDLTTDAARSFLPDAEETEGSSNMNAAESSELQRPFSDMALETIAGAEEADCPSLEQDGGTSSSMVKDTFSPTENKGQTD